MKKMTIFQKIYGNKQNGISAFKNILHTDMGELDVTFEVYADEDGWAVLEIEGGDEEFAYNVLRTKYSSPVSEVEMGKTYPAIIKRVRDDGVLVDTGIEVLIPFSAMRIFGEGTCKQIF